MSSAMEGGIYCDNEQLVLEDGTVLDSDDYRFYHPEGTLHITHVASFRDGEFEIFDTILKRMGVKTGCWKAFGMYGMTKSEVLFLAKLTGAIKPYELRRLREINEKMEGMIERAVTRRQSS